MYTRESNSREIAYNRTNDYDEAKQPPSRHTARGYRRRRTPTTRNMPFLKDRKVSRLAERIEKSKRNGWRHAVYGTTSNPKAKYTGNWKDDKKDGFGREIDRSNVSYEGEWSGGKKHGFGILGKLAKNGNPIKLYAGCWRDGGKDGFGLNWREDGFYKGSFRNNERHGFGRMWWCDRPYEYYEGSWADDSFHGSGKLFYRNGNRYEGQFARGKKEGIGSFRHERTGQTQRGVWRDDACVTSTMEDGTFRRYATCPTPYPIPEFMPGLKNMDYCRRMQVEMEMEIMQ